MTTLAGHLHIALLIRSLNYGGAEMQAIVLANALVRLGHAVCMIVFYSGGPLLDRLDPGVRVACLNKRGRWDVLGFVRGLFRVLEGERPDVLYALLPVANLLACLARLRSPKQKLAWGVRASDMDLSRYDRLSRFTYWLESRLSHCPNLIIANSAAGRRQAVSRGFPDDGRFVVIPNGIDTERFRPDTEARSSLRAEWTSAKDEVLIGIVARLDPMKDHPNFLAAAARVTQAGYALRFVSVGGGPCDYAASLREQATLLGLQERMTWAGPRDNLPTVYSALDLLVSSSLFGEGFSNVLGEAMACCVPCVATDVGDARDILGDCGVVVPPGDPDALAAGITRMLDRIRIEGARLGQSARARIMERYSVETLAHRTYTALQAIK